MSYEVLLTERAVNQLEEAARWWSEHRSASEAERWYGGFLQSIVSLGKNPLRCPLARESGAFPYELRQLAYGLSSQYTHRAVFTVRGNDVVVLAIRHLARADIAPDELE